MTDTQNTSHCQREDCDYYPYYGVGPHTSDFDHPIGGTRHYPSEDWPDNYRPDPDAPGCGTYFCPDCKEGMQNGQ